MTDQERKAIENMQTAKTLKEFEDTRAEASYFPPDQSDSFWYIGEESEYTKPGYIDLFTMGKTFMLELIEGTLFTGAGVFTFDQTRYISGKINAGSRMVINDGLLLDNVVFDIYGDIELAEGAELELRNGAKINFDRTSTLVINKNARITIDTDSLIFTYGTMEVDVDYMDDLMPMDKFYQDPSAVIKPINMNLGDREYSMTDYDADLRKGKLTPNTQGDKVTPNGRLRYVWKNGQYSDGSQIIDLYGSYGDVVLGDFKLSILGIQEDIIPGLQIDSNLIIEKNMTLHIAESYNNCTYLYPELYIGAVPENNKESGTVEVYGNIIADGENSHITIDRLGQLIIKEGGTVQLKNSSFIVSKNNDDAAILKINGTLIVDDVYQLSLFNPSNIVFGDNGKIVILNPSDEDKILFTTPNGIYSDEPYNYLYYLLLDKIDHVEYHISPNTGIKIDRNYSYPAVEFTDWFGGRRIEQAVHDGILVWEDNAFMVLDNAILPWANLNCSLLEASKLFKSFASIDSGRLIDVANRFKYAGFGNVRFRFVQGTEYRDITMNLTPVEVNSVITTPATDEYSVNVSEEGNLFIRNQATTPDPDNIISNESKSVNLSPGDNVFNLS